jgi:streptomycin 6-kinase
MTGELIEPGFRAFVVRTFGEEGRAWLSRLPRLLEQLAVRWQLELGDELPGGLLSCVRAARRADGRVVVLKVSAPTVRVRDEIAALRAWGGLAAPELLAADEPAGALLLERIDPGTHPEGASPRAVARLLAALHVPPPAGMRALGEVVAERVRRALEQERTSRQKAAWALARLDELARTDATDVLLHGDFDERNLLVCDRRGLVAIDPLPCAGDPAYDAGYWVHGNRRRGRRARLEAIVAATGLERARVRDWAAVVGVHG